jgi:ATP-binding cassette subfamily B protein
MTIDPAIALFPFIACIINLVTILWIKSTVYKMSLEIDPVIRKRNYSRRVFYQSDYAKEIKLTNIKQSLLKQFFESIEEERSIAKKHGLKIVLVKLSNYVVGWTICVYCLPPLYMVYNTIVTKRISQSNMATTYNANTNVFYNLNDMSNRIMELQSIGLFAESFKHFMNYEVKIENLSGDGIESDEPKLIEIKNLSFKYNEKGSNIINNINMKIRPNEKIAIVGHNGAGKSTFIKLLLHLYEASEGEIYYNGKNIKEYDVHEYRKIFGTIFQNSEVYAGTVAENVLMDYVTKENIHLVDDALGYGLIKNKIQSLEYGINTQLTREFDDDGIILSGGEKQKIAISRLFTKKFPVTILDEPSSALDAFAEFELNNNMMSVTKDSTVIFISHRLSTTRMADRIYMFENGKIIEEGSHDELMQLDGEYAKMFRVQSMYYEV